MCKISDHSGSTGTGSVGREDSAPKSDTRRQTADPSELYAKIRAANRKVKLIDVLNQYGIRIVKGHRSDWSYNITCPLRSHKGGKERTASFAYCYKDDHFYCLSGDTRVMTRGGVREIRDLVGQTHKVLGKGADWIDGYFDSYGKQPLWEIHLTRNGQHKIVHATAEHRWFVRSGKHRYDRREVVTKDLKPGHGLSYVFPRCHTSHMALSPFGIAHGIVFGDGTANKAGSFAYLHGKKDDELKKWFPLNKITPDKRRDDKVIVHNLPRYFKDRPQIEEAAQYLFGWLAGYFAADGCVSKDGTVSISSAIRDNLEFVRAVCTRLGIGTYGVTEHLRKGFPDRDESSIFNIHLINDTLTSEFFLISKHRDRFESNIKQFSRRGWVVRSVKETDRVEEVFCAKVEDGHAFALEDNILTGNCMGCRAAGHAVEFISLYTGKSRGAIADAILSRYSEDVVVDEYDNRNPEIEKALFDLSGFVREIICNDPRRMAEVDKIMWWFDSYLAVSSAKGKIVVEDLEHRVTRAKELLSEDQ